MVCCNTEIKYVVKYCGLYLYQNGNMFTTHEHLARTYKTKEAAEKWITNNKKDYYRVIEFTIEIVEVRKKTSDMCNMELLAELKYYVDLNAKGNGSQEIRSYIKDLNAKVLVRMCKQ